MYSYSLQASSVATLSAGGGFWLWLKTAYGPVWYGLLIFIFIALAIMVIGGVRYQLGHRAFKRERKLAAQQSLHR